jgi:arylsulfatase A
MNSSIAWVSCEDSKVRCTKAVYVCRQSYDIPKLSRPEPAGTTGLSIARALKGQDQPPRPYLYREFPGYGGQQSIRVDNWKAIRQKLNQGKVDVELYDLSKDPSEKENVAKAHPEVVAKLEGMMREARTPSSVFPLKNID